MNRYCGLAAALLSATVVACASRPARFYTLSPSAVETDAPLSVAVAVGPVSIPAVDDHPMLMLSIGPNEIQPDEFARWASPLPENIARAVVANLKALLGTSRATVAAESSGEAPGYRVAISVHQFDSFPGQAAALDALWTVRRTSDGALRTGRSKVREAVAGKDIGALAAAHSRTVAHLSEEIAAAVRSLADAQP